MAKATKICLMLVSCMGAGLGALSTIGNMKNAIYFYNEL